MNAIKLLKMKFVEKQNMNPEKFSYANVAERLTMKSDDLIAILNNDTQAKTLDLIRICEAIELNIHEVRELTQLHCNDLALDS